MLGKENIHVQMICVDEDGALAHSSDLTNFLKTEVKVSTTGGYYASFLNGKVEPHN